MMNLKLGLEQENENSILSFVISGKQELVWGN